MNPITQIREDEVWISVERTIQIAQYEPIKIIMGHKHTVGPNEKPDEIRNQICRKLVCDTIQEAENIRNNPDQYMEQLEPLPDQGRGYESPSTDISATTVRRRRNIT